MNQLFCKEQASRLGDCDRRGPEVLVEESAQLTRAHPEARRECLDRSILMIEKAVGNQREGTRNRIGCASPAWQFGRDFRTIAQAGAESGGLGGSAAGKNVQLFRFGVLAGQMGRQ